jgi:hypothetical protein
MATQAIGNAVDSVTATDGFRSGKALGHAAFDALKDEVTTDDEDADGFARADLMGTVRVIGGAMIGLAVLVVVLDEVFSINSISNSSGPFSGVIDSLESTGVAALSLLVIGLLVAAANRVMGFFGGGGF